MEPFQLEQTSGQLRLSVWEELWPGLSAGFSTQSMDNFALHVADDPMQVVERRKRLALSLGFDFAAWTSVQQVHGVEVKEVTVEQRGTSRFEMDENLPYDAMVTQSPHVLLATYFADCVPIYYCHPESGWLGLAHAGWRGTVQGMVLQVLHRLCRQKGVPLSQLQVAIGPSIGPCYQVDERVMAPLRTQLPNDWEDVTVALSPGQWRLDLKEANRRLLKAHGLSEEQIMVSHFCTACDETLFFSHRREGSTGRMVAWLGWRSR